MKRVVRTAVGVIVLVALAVIGRNVIVPDLCQSLDPNSWYYWLLGCSKDAAGGGAGGAG